LRKKPDQPSYRTGTADVTRHRLRQRFLSVLAEEAPETIEALRGLQSRVVPALERIAPTNAFPRMDTPPCWEPAQLPRAVHAWARHFNLHRSHNDWLILVAADTLLDWDLRDTSPEEWQGIASKAPNSIRPLPPWVVDAPRAFRMPHLVLRTNGDAHFFPLFARPKWARMGGGSFTYFAPESAPLYLEPETWHPLGESWGRFAKRARKRLELALTKYKQTQSATLVSRGGLVSTRKTEEKHLHWFIQYQVQGHTYREIADLKMGTRTESESAPRSPDNVRRSIAQAVADTADLLGITLRPSGRG
jgi:hypothetical protein